MMLPTTWNPLLFLFIIVLELFCNNNSCHGFLLPPNEICFADKGYGGDSNSRQRRRRWQSQHQSSSISGEKMTRQFVLYATNGNNDQEEGMTNTGSSTIATLDTVDDEVRNDVPSTDATSSSSSSLLEREKIKAQRQYLKQRFGMTKAQINRLIRLSSTSSTATTDMYNNNTSCVVDIDENANENVNKNVKEDIDAILAWLCKRLEICDSNDNDDDDDDDDDGDETKSHQDDATMENSTAAPYSTASVVKRKSSQNETLKQILLRAPIILQLNVDVLEEKFQWLKRMYGMKSNKKLAQVLTEDNPSLIKYLYDGNLEQNLPWVKQRLGLTGKELYKLIESSPYLTHGGSGGSNGRIGNGNDDRYGGELNGEENDGATRSTTTSSDKHDEVDLCLYEKFVPRLRYMEGRMGLCYYDETSSSFTSQKAVLLPTTSSSSSTVPQQQKQFASSSSSHWPHSTLKKIILAAPSVWTFRIETLQEKFDWFERRLAMNSLRTDETDGDDGDGDGDGEGTTTSTTTMKRSRKTTTTKKKKTKKQPPPPKTITSLFVRVPQLLIQDVEYLEKKVSWFERRLNLSDEQVRKIFNKCPKILSNSVDDTISPRLEYIQQRLLLDDGKLQTMICRLPQVMLLSSENNIEPTIEFYESLLERKEKGKENINSPSSAAAAATACELIGNQPVYLAVSLERRLKPRLSYAIEHGYQFGKDFEVRHLAKLTDEEWEGHLSIAEMARSGDDHDDD